MRTLLVSAAAVILALVPSAASTGALPVEVRSLDGGGNNLLHPRWGQVGTNYLRVARPNYADGVNAMVAGPPARYVSNRVFNDVSQNIFSENGVSQWAWLWGQFLDHTFGLRDETPAESEPIAYRASDPLEGFRNDFGVIQFSRTPPAPETGVTYPREQVNTVSSYIDAWAVYGGTATRLEWLRRGAVDGDMSNNRAALLLPGNYLPRVTARNDPASAPQMDLMGRLLADTTRAIVAGDVRANENIALTGVHTLFAREHNRIVAALPDTLSEEDKFQIARRVVGAEQQWITYTQFLPALGVELSPYAGYNPNVNAGLANEFAAVGYRAHSQIHGEMEVIARAGRYTQAELDAFEAQGIEVAVGTDDVELTIPLNLAFGNPDLLTSVGLGPLLKGFASERQYRNDEQIDNQLRSVLFQVPRPGVDPTTCLDGPPLPDCFSGVVDLGAIDVQRGRDHGMPFYNDLRATYGLSRKLSFAAVTGEGSESFPSDPLIDAAYPIDDPNILDFVRLLDRNGAVVKPGTEAAEEGVVTAIRRTPLAARLKAIYGDVNRLDAFVGMVSEPHVPGTELGRLQLTIWRKQFEALRDGDRFFYANDPFLDVIKQLYGIDYRQTLANVIELNTGANVQPDVFEAPLEEPAPAGPQLVAAYGFDEGAGSTAGDASGNGNVGTTANTAWLATGKFGKALSFNGSSSWVTVADSPSLDLTSGMTLEAWVKPAAAGTSWRTVLIKQKPDGLDYTLYTNDGAGHPVSQLQIGGERIVTGPTSIPLGSWTHLAATYDGAALVLYVNGVAVASKPQTGAIETSAEPLRIGGNSVWSEWFQGAIDEVRIYDGPIPQAQIQADMATAIVP